jgi:hypothetical protein
MWTPHQFVNREMKATYASSSYEVSYTSSQPAGWWECHVTTQLCTDARADRRSPFWIERFASF